MIWETLTCLEQLVFVGTQYDLSRREARRRSLELLDVLGLSEKKNRLAKTLSGGMKRRLNLALALVHDPELLVLDEPQAGLDPQSRVLVREYILSLAREKTVILTTHEMDEADRLRRADRHHRPRAPPGPGYTRPSEGEARRRRYPGDFHRGSGVMAYPGSSTAYRRT